MGEVRSVAKGFAHADRAVGFLSGRHSEDFVCLHAPGRQEGMLSRDQTMDILFLHKQGHSNRRIAHDVEARAENDEMVNAGEVPLQSRIVEGRPGSRLMLHRGYLLIGVAVDPRHVASQAVCQ